MVSPYRYHDNNRLIAMMGKTYQDIASQGNENLRQWARILLIVERTLTDKERLYLFEGYTSLAESTGHSSKYAPILKTSTSKCSQSSICTNDSISLSCKHDPNNINNDDDDIQQRVLSSTWSISVSICSFIVNVRLRLGTS